MPRQCKVFHAPRSNSKWLIIINFGGNPDGNEKCLLQNIQHKSIQNKVIKTNVYYLNTREEKDLAFYLIEL
jgi:hypothetical protein